MAYKFQLGNAKLGGSLQQDGGFVSSSVDDVTAANIVSEIDNGEIPIAKLAANTISGKSLGGNLDALTTANNSGLTTITYTGASAVALAVELKANDGLDKDNTGIFVKRNGTSIAVGASGISVNAGSVDHNTLQNYDGNKHIDHTSVSMQAGNGLTGGGDIAANRSFAVQVQVNNGLAVEVAGVKAVGYASGSIQINADGIGVKTKPNGGVTHDGSSGLVIEAGKVTDAMLAGSISNANLQNQSVTIGSTAINLGATANDLRGMQGLQFDASARTIDMLDSAHDAHANSLTLKAGKPTAGTTNNKNGGNLVLEGGQSKGTGTGGSIQFRVSTASGVAGSAMNSTNQAMIITQDKNCQMAGDLTIDGDLIVSGDTVTMNVANLAVEDNLIVIRNGADAADNSGIQIGSTGTPVTLKMSDSAANLQSSVPLKASSFIGALNGNANTATLATTVTISDAESTNAEHALVFTSDLDGGDVGLKSDGDITYNPSLNGGTLTCPRFSGDGSALTNVPGSSTVSVADEQTDATCFLMFGVSATGAQGMKSNANLTFNSSIGELGANLKGSVKINARMKTTPMFINTSGGSAPAWTSNAYTLDSGGITNHYIYSSTHADDDQFNLTAISGQDGRMLIFKNGHATNAMRIDANGTEKIEGVDAYITLEAGGALTLVCIGSGAGAGWYVH